MRKAWITLEIIKVEADKFGKRLRLHTVLQLGVDVSLFSCTVLRENPQKHLFLKHPEVQLKGLFVTRAAATVQVCTTNSPLLIGFILIHLGQPGVWLHIFAAKPVL